MIPHVIRPAVDEDLPRILSDWGRSFRGAFSARDTWNDLYFSDAGQMGVIKRCLARATTLVAASPDDSEHILAWGCFEPVEAGQHGPMVCVHFAYVTKLYRRNDLCRALMEAAGIDLDAKKLLVSHANASTQGWSRSGTQVLYVPYLATMEGTE